MAKPKPSKSGSPPPRRHHQVSYVLHRPEQEPEVVTLSVTQGSDAGSTFRSLFGSDWEITEMRSRESTIGAPHLVELMEQGIPVYGAGAPLQIVCHQWRGHRIYAGPDYDKFMEARRAGVFALVPLTESEISIVMRSFVGTSPNELPGMQCTHIEYADDEPIQS